MGPPGAEPGGDGLSVNQGAWYHPRGFLTLLFPLLPIPARVALELLSVKGTPAGTERAVGFLLPWALLPRQIQAGL